MICDDYFFNMEKLELYGILKKLTFLMLFSFVLFLFFVNVSKVASYMIQINQVIDTALKEDEKGIEVIQNPLNYYEDLNYMEYDQEVAHTALELEYRDALIGTELKNKDWDEGVNILITGSDRKNSHDVKSRSDTIVVLRINEFGQILSISIPRDTLIEIEGEAGRKYYDKIGHSMYWEGLDGLKNSVESLIGSPIYRVVIIDNFRSFEAFLSILGGVSIDKKLEGELGIQWIRNRSFRLGDIERCRRQQVFLKKAVGKIWKITRSGNYFLTSVLFDNMRKVVQTDLTKKDFYNLLYLLKSTHFNPDEDFYTAVLPGKFGTYDSLLLRKKNLSCWILEEDVSERLHLLFYSPYQSNFLKRMSLTKRDFMKIDLNLFLKNVRSHLLKNNEGQTNNMEKARVVELVDTLVSGTSER